jgi:hypothetical protein
MKEKSEEVVNPLETLNFIFYLPVGPIMAPLKKWSIRRWLLVCKTNNISKATFEFGFILIDHIVQAINSIIASIILCLFGKYIFKSIQKINFWLTTRST